VTRTYALYYCSKRILAVLLSISAILLCIACVSLKIFFRDMLFTFVCNYSGVCSPLPNPTLLPAAPSSTDVMLQPRLPLPSISPFLGSVFLPLTVSSLFSHSLEDVRQGAVLNGGVSARAISSLSSRAMARSTLLLPRWQISQTSSLYTRHRPCFAVF
jgi:hypothetical protein